MSRKLKTALLALVVSLLLTILKTAVGFATMSISILASALDSLMDMCSSVITMAAILTSEKPADEEHPFGHGKAEAIAGLVQAFFIMASAGFLIYQAFNRIVKGYQLVNEGAGINLMIAAMVVSILLARAMKKVGKETESTAITAGALNFSADVWTNAGVIVALGLEHWGSVKNADPIISILISLYIIVSAVRITRDAVTQLMDKALPTEMLKIIDRCITAHGKRVRGYHKLRTRRVGGEKYIEFHLEIESGLSFKEAHHVTETIVDDIERAISGSHVTVHSDPS